MVIPFNLRGSKASAKTFVNTVDEEERQSPELEMRNFPSQVDCQT